MWDPDAPYKPCLAGDSDSGTCFILRLYYRHQKIYIWAKDCEVKLPFISVGRAQEYRCWICSRNTVKYVQLHGLLDPDRHTECRSLSNRGTVGKESPLSPARRHMICIWNSLNKIVASNVTVFCTEKPGSGYLLTQDGWSRPHRNNCGSETLLFLFVWISTYCYKALC